MLNVGATIAAFVLSLVTILATASKNIVIKHANCSFHGILLNNRCYCENGSSGEKCERKKCYPACSIHGACEIKDNVAKCVCDESFSGSTCSESVCPNNCFADKGQGICIDVPAKYNNNETTIERVSECKIPTEFGEFDLVAYQDTIDKQVHFALVNGEVKSDQTTNVRVHLQNTFSDNFFSDRLSPRTWPMSTALARLSKDGGVLVMLGHQETAESLIEQIKYIKQEDAGERVAAKAQGASRRVGVGSQILRDLGVQKMALFSSQKKYHALSGFGLEVVEYITE